MFFPKFDKEPPSKLENKAEDLFVTGKFNIFVTVKRPKASGYKHVRHRKLRTLWLGNVFEL